jgi:hypothetical protein
MIEGAVPNNCHEPSRKAIGIATRLQPLEGHKKCLLGHIFGIFPLTGDPEGHKPSCALIPSDNLSKGLFVAHEGAPNQLPIGEPGF